MADPKHPRKFSEEFKRQIVQLYDNGKSPAEIRMINAFHEGDYGHIGNLLRAVSTIETMQGVAKMADLPLDEEYMKMSSKEVAK